MLRGFAEAETGNGDRKEKRTTEKGKLVMDKRERLRAGIAEMRSVAQRLNQWADDLEASFRGEEAPEQEVDAGESAVASKEEGTADQAGAEPEAAPKTGKALTLPEVRAVLAGKCAEGFGTQVKALIQSYGASTLKEVPAEKYGELLEAVKGLGDADAG